MKEYIAPLLRFGALILLLTTIYEQNKSITHYKGEVKALKATIEKIDSAASNQYDELFAKQTEVGRYEMALEMLKEEDKAAAKKFESKLDETE